MLQKIILSLLLIGGLTDINAQTSPVLNNNLVPPPPEAAALGKYGILPVTLYTGTPNISVPIMDVKSTELSLPVSFGYNYNGYRPGEEASSVGLGWNIEGGGIITRVAKGLVDADNLLNPSITPWDSYANVMFMTDDMNFMDALGDGDTRTQDGEPDIYLFHFNGHSGKFIMVGDRAYMFPRQNLEITQNFTGNFTITTEDGTIYNFFNKDTTTSLGESNLPPNYTGDWNLTNMISADRTDTISFQYQSYYPIPSGEGYSETYQQFGHTSVPYGDGFACTGNSGCDLWTVNYSPVSIQTGKWLNRINFKNGYIQFIPDSLPRLDLSGGPILREIDVYNSSTALIKKLQLLHGYFGDPRQAVECQLKLDSIEISGYYSNSITDTSALGQQAPAEWYSFQYANATTGSFPKFTRGIDHWGYYNGYDGNAMLFDASITSYTPLEPPANRSVDTATCINGMLTQINYPTGGYTQFTYENNVSAIGIWDPGTGPCGLNSSIEATAAYDGSGLTVEKEGTFTIDSILCPAFNSPPNTEPVTIQYGQNVPAGQNGVKTFNRLFEITSLTADTTYTFSNLGYDAQPENDVLNLPPGTYNWVLTCANNPYQNHPNSTFMSIQYYQYQAPPAPEQYNIPGPGMRIKTIESFDNLNSTPSLIRNYTYSIPTFLSAPSYLEYSVNVVGDNTNSGTENFFISNYSSPLSTLLDEEFYYPTVTEFTDSAGANGETVYQFGGQTDNALGVEMLSQSDYSLISGNYTLLKQKNNFYSYHKLIDFYAETALLSKLAIPGPACACTAPLPDPDPFDIPERFKLYNPTPYYLESAWNQLDSSTDITFDQTGQNPMTFKTAYNYDDPDYLQPSRVTTWDSKGEAITVQYKYPVDYNITGDPFLYSVDTNYITSFSNASYTYETCVELRDSLANLVWNPAIGNADNQALINVINSNNCEAAYAINTKATVSNMNIAAGNYFTYSPTAILQNQGIELMQDYNICTKPIEVIQTINKSSGDYLLSAMKTDYIPNPNSTELFEVVPSTMYHAPENALGVLSSAFQANPSNYYVPKVFFNYDQNDNTIQQNKANDVLNSYIWDYNNAYPVAQVKNASQSSIAYTSFEWPADVGGSGNWLYSGTPVADATSPTGNYCYQLSSGNNITTANTLNAANTYEVSYWTKGTTPLTIYGTITGFPVRGKTINGWTYYEHRITGKTSIVIGGSLKIDELRLYPYGSQMTTYAYTPLVGMTDECDVNNRITYYYYDALSRLNLVRDQDTNIIKKICYTLAGQPTNCNVSMYYNTADTAYLPKSCGADSTGTVAAYIVSAGTYTSSVSQAAANQLAQNDVNANAQNYANANGSCILSGGINLVLTDYASSSGFNVTYTNLGTGQQYTFAIPVYTNQLSNPHFANIPRGSYNVTFTTVGSTSPCLFGINCSGAQQTMISGTSATFYNVVIGGSVCNTGIIIYPLQN
jgi:hypothetical protein